jgi:hypothetical protein
MLRASLEKVVHTVKRAGTYAAKVPPQEFLYMSGLWGAPSPTGEGLGESQFRRLEKKLSTLPTLWVNVFLTRAGALSSQLRKTRHPADEDITRSFNLFYVL